MYKPFFVLVGFVLLFGCAQMGEKVANEMGTCLENCQDLCSLAKNNSLDLEGFNELKLTKQSGSVSVHCSCTCY